MNKEFVEKLQKILDELLKLNINRLKDVRQFDGMTLEKIFLKYSITEEWERMHIMRILKLDQLLQPYDSTELSDQGIKFALNGGYTAMYQASEASRIIVEKTIEKFKYDKWAFWMSVISILASIYAIFREEINYFFSK